jgi:hypothetical protein
MKLLRSSTAATVVAATAFALMGGSATANETSALGNHCTRSADGGEIGAKACFVDYRNGADDGLRVCDIDRDKRRQTAYAVIYEEEHPLDGFDYQIGESDGGDKGCDTAWGFDIGDDNNLRLKVCVRYKGHDYGKGKGDHCHKESWTEQEG